MTAPELLDHLESQGVEFYLEGADRLGFRAPAGTLNPTLRGQLKAAKGELLDLVAERARRAEQAQTEQDAAASLEPPAWWPEDLKQALPEYAAALAHDGRHPDPIGAAREVLDMGARYFRHLEDGVDRARAWALVYGTGPSEGGPLPS